MLVKKLNSSPSLINYPLLFVTSRNTTFPSLAETWMPKLEKNRNHKFSLTDFTIENRLTCLNTNSQKRKGKLWTYTYANNDRAHRDYVFINKKWNDSALNCEGYSSFEGESYGHRIVMAKIRLSLRKNATRTTNIVLYDWALFNNRDIRDKYALALRNKYVAQHEKIDTYSELRIWEFHQRPPRSGSGIHTN